MNSKRNHPSRNFNLLYHVAVTLFPLIWVSIPTPATGQPAATAGKTNESAANTKIQTKDQAFELTVVDSAGKAIPDVTVEIRSTPGLKRQQLQQGVWIKATKYDVSLKADSGGQLKLSLPAQTKFFVAQIRQPGYGPYWAEWNSHEHPQVIPDKFVAQLDPAWSVGGIVVDGNGKPVQGAEVNPSIEFKKRDGDTRQFGAGASVKTDADGKWSYPSVPDAMKEVFVEIDHPNFMPERRSLTRAEFGISSGTQPAAKIVLNPGITITGIVVDETGKPIEGALLRAKFLNDIRKAKTGADGSYSLAGCEPRTARVVVSAKGRAMDFKEVRFEPDMEPVDFMMKPGGKIRIRVVDKAGRPIPKSRIFFQRWRGRIGYFEFDHVNQYANKDGIWEWNEAPLDEIKADICPPNGMQLSEQSFIARDEEYVFRPPTALVITGTVVDAETKQPIKSFRVVPGIRNENPRIGINWDRNSSYTATSGKFRVRRNREYLGHIVRIEADGYQPEMSEDIKSDEENVVVDFELKKGKNVTATVLTPEGAPAAGAKIAIGVPRSQIGITNGDIDDGSTYAARLNTDGSGKFHFPPQDGEFQLIITHRSGYASIQGTHDWDRTTIKLNPWARVEGKFHVGTKAIANAPISVQTRGIDRHGEGGPNIFTSYRTTTAPDGRFVFDRVVPGSGYIGREMVLMIDDGATEVTSCKMVPIECRPGETTKINLGGDGRPVVGILAPPPDHNQKVMWNLALVRIELDLPQLNVPQAPPAVQNDPTKFRAWLNEWQLTPDGQAWKMVADANERMRTTAAHFTASVDRDGSFRIDDVPPGNYLLHVSFSKNPAGRLTGHRFSIPKDNADQTDVPIDLGTLTLKP